MKSIALAVSFAALAYAQLPNVPSCSLNCFVSALTGDGCSGLTDFKCHCGKPGLAAQVVPCVKSSCPNQSDQASVVQIVSSECNAVGVPITVSLDASDSAALASATGGSGGSSGSSGSSGSGSGSASATGSASGSSSTGAAMTFSVAGPATTSGSSGSGSGSGGSSAASGSPAQFTGAADHNMAHGAALGVGIAALVAAL